MSTPADSLNSNTSQSEDIVIGRSGSPMVSEFLQEYRSRSISPSPKQSIVFNRDSDAGLGHLTELRQRINGLEEQRLQLTTTHNEQITNLEGDVALWRAQAERGEASKQKLEYELAVLKKALAREKESARSKEHEMKKNLQQHEGMNNELATKAEELSKTLQLRDKETRQVVEAFKKEVNQKESEVKRLRDENERLRKDKEQIENVFAEQENLYSDAQEKLANLRMERDTQTESVRRQLKDLHYSAEREERFKKEMEVALTKIKTLEENTEAERAAHLETKFNSELIQLRVRDLQGALEVEKAAHSELILKSESMSKQISDLETLYSKEKLSASDLKSQLERVQSECTSVRSRLSAEVEGKHVMVTDMSEQLQIHQESFAELKEELKKAKKRQAYLEETYGGCMKELELLIDNVQQMNQPIGKRGRGKQRDTPSPSEVLETLRQLTNDFQKRLNLASKEVTRLKTACEKMNNECERYKEIMWEQDKTNKDLQKKLTVSTKELEKVRHSLNEHQTQTSAFKVALQRAEQDHYSEKNKGQDLAEEFIRQLKSHEDKLENRKVYLHGLYERIRSGPTIPGLTVVSLSDPDWDQLTGVVQDQIAALMNAFNQANQKVSKLTSSIRHKEELLHKTQEAHEDSLNKLKATEKKREEEWTSQRKKMEKHYERQLADLRNKAEQKENAQQAWSSMQTATAVKSELEENCGRYRQQLDESQGHLHSALTASSLLIGSLLAYRAQIAELISERESIDATDLEV
ncbi:putative coiled-coil domain-containing protein [Apostichopus japonicus]|uniref:Putative coiled-coil domain-containing protein n=1 Tax=Stichopus japonicus TaxID=307972 RepID=A0A2G8LA50_STIJA|nr:putative coiled-coil domain-containing protein [Apostichopus japonicus]